MPRYYIDTFDGLVVLDDVGHDLPDDDAARATVRQTLAAMMKDGSKVDGRSSAQFRADVRNEAGDRVMTATILMVIDDTTWKPTVLRD